MEASYQACGKFILVGEHFILYDIPALAMPWNDVAFTLSQTSSPEPVQERIAQSWQHARTLVGLEKTATFPFSFQSTIPQGAGFGSSAALCLSLLEAATHEANLTLSTEQRIEHATTLESLFHGRSSGLDPTVVAHKKPLRVRMGQPPQPFSWELNGYGFVLSVSREQRQTAEAVHKVRMFSEAQPQRFAAMLDTMRELVTDVEALVAGSEAIADLSFDERGQRMGNWLNTNHSLLAELGVSSPHLEELVQVARDHGALGAKLTGAGMGGGMVALAPEAALDSLSKALQQAGGQHTTACRPSHFSNSSAAI